MSKSTPLTRKLFCFHLILIPVFLFAQVPSISLTKTLGGTKNDIPYIYYQTNDNGYIIGGIALSKDGDVSGQHSESDLWIVKLDAGGNVQWKKTLGGSKTERGIIIQQTNDGGYIVGGETFSNNGNVSGNHGTKDIWIVKLDANGNIQWQKVLGGTEHEALTSILIAADGNYLIGGRSFSNNGDVSGNHGDWDIWILKLNPTGNILWKKTLGGSQAELLHQLHISNDGGIIVGATTFSNDGNVTGNHGNKDIWVVKLDINGNLQWQKTFGGSNEEDNVVMESTADGGYIIGSSSFSSDGDIGSAFGSRDFWIFKIDAIGALQWEHSFGGSFPDFFYALSKTTDGGFIAAGETSSSDGQVTNFHGGTDVWVIRLDGAGNLQWQKTLGGSANDAADLVQQTSDNGYVLLGYTNSNNGDITSSHGGIDCWMIKLDVNGNLQWQRTFGGTNIDYFTKYGTGNRLSSYSLQFQHNQYLNYQSVFPGFKLQANDGGYFFAVPANSNDGDVSGLHRSSGQGGPMYDYWFVKLTADISSPKSITSSPEHESGFGELNIYPNPASDNATIRFVTLYDGKVEVEVYNIHGQKIRTLFSKPVLRGSAYSVNLELTSLPNGIYVVMIRNGKNFQSARIFKQK
jgi:hypothetical protein